MTSKRKRLPSILLDLLVAAICLSAFYFSLKYFFIELNRNTVRSDITSIGQVQYKYKVAQRKFEDRVVWERLQINSTLYNGDIIRTASGGAAGILFANASSLELGENTMIQIFITEDGDFVISLDSGTVAVESSNVENNSQLSLQMKNGSEIVLKPGVSFTAETTASGESLFTVKQGEVTVTDDTGVEQQLFQGESFTQSKEGKLSQKAVSASTPARILNFEQKPVDVKIDLKVIDEYKQDKLVIETSTSPDFSEISNIYTKNASENFTIPVEEGKVYWRIYPQSDAENKTVGEVNVIKVPGINLVAPVNKSEHKIKEELNLNFVWEENSQASHYKFQLAKDSDFTNIIVEEKVYDGKYNCTLKAENLNQQKESYFWRVIPYYGLGNTGYKIPSSYSSFTVEKEQVSEIVRPALIYPTEKLEVITKDEDTQLTFMWESENPMTEYKLQVSKSRDFSNCAIDLKVYQTVSVQQINALRFTEGTYYWKVTGYSKDNGTAVESVTKSFEIKKESLEPVALILPEDIPESEENSAIEIAMENAGITLPEKVTETVEKEKETVTAVVTQPAESTTVKPAETKPATTTTTKPVETKPATTTPAATTAPEPVIENKVVEQKTLADPVLVEPSKDATIDTEYIKTNRKVVFIWDEVKDATDYTFDLYQVLPSGGKKRVAQQKNIETNRYEFADLTKLQNGNFEWRITAYKHTGNSDTTIHSKQVAQVFTIEIGLPGKVNTISPGEQYGE